MTKTTIIKIARVLPEMQCYLCHRTLADFSTGFFTGVEAAIHVQDRNTLSVDGRTEGAKFTPEPIFELFTFTYHTDAAGKEVRAWGRVGTRFYYPSDLVLGFLSRVTLPRSARRPEVVIEFTLSLRMCPTCNALFKKASDAAFTRLSYVSG